jgi:hypothetical protein
MPIPASLVDYFLLGKTRPDALERFTQDGGVVTDVWLAFAADAGAVQRVLIEPALGVTTGQLGYALHMGIKHYRATDPRNERQESPSIVPLENFVAASITRDELIRVA